MRKLIISTMAFLLLAVQPITAAAATTASNLPSSIDILYQVNVSNIDVLESFIIESLQEDLSISEMDLAERILTDNTFELGLDLDENTDFTTGEGLNTYVSFQLSEEDLSALLAEQEDTYTETTYEDTTIYNLTDGYGVHLNGTLYIAATEELAQQLIDTSLSGEGRLADDETFQNASAYFLDDAFLNMYVNPGEVLNITMPTETSTFFNDDLVSPNFYTPEYTDALLSEAISIAKTNSGFDFTVYVEGDSEKLAELDMPMNKFEFTPKLYKLVSGDNLMLYTESTDLKGAVDNMLAVTTESSPYNEFFNDLDESLMDSSDLDLQTDILDLLDSNYMLTMHDSEQVIPAFTLVFDASAHKTLAKANMAILNEKIKTAMLEEEEFSGENFYSIGTTEVGTSTLPQHIIDLKTLMEDSSTLKTSDLRLYLTMGVTDKGMVVISTHPALDSIWNESDASEGVLSNSGLAKAWTDQSQVITGVFYFDIDTLNQYMTALMPKAEAPEEVSSFFSGLLDPWHNVFAQSESTQNTATVSGSVDVDVPDLANYEDLFAEYDAYQAEQTAAFMEQMNLNIQNFYAGTFCDVPEGAWFYEPITMLYSKGIISGYEDGCFHPGDDISRAEFTKLAFAAAEQVGLTGSVAMSDADNYFTDVSSDAWYWHYVNQAAANDIVNGYPDGSFHPNDTITRAEAVQVLYNASAMLQIQNYADYENSYTDISDSDWYEPAVAVFYHEGILTDSGSHLFNPGNNINRAEAAKIIYQFMELHQ